MFDIPCYVALIIMTTFTLLTMCIGSFMVGWIAKKLHISWIYFKKTGKHIQDL